MNYDSWEPDIDWESVTYKQRIEILFVVYSLLDQYLEAVCGERTSFLKPDDGMTSNYRYLRTVIPYSETEEIFKAIGYLDPMGYPEFLEKRDDMIRHWQDFKPAFLNHFENIKKEFVHLKCDSASIIVPRVIGILHSGASYCLKLYLKEKQSIQKYHASLHTPIRASEKYHCDDLQHIFVTGDVDHVLRFQSNNIRYKIFKMLFKELGDFVPIKRIAKHVGIEVTAVRPAINNIRQSIKRQKLDSRLHIIPSRYGSYKLVIVKHS